MLPVQSGLNQPPLPIGLNRISWKLRFTELIGLHITKSLPIGLNRISWKLPKNKAVIVMLKIPLPIGLNRISWKQIHGQDALVVYPPGNSLPIGLNRISWKRVISVGAGTFTDKLSAPYLLG
jgi:type IV secretory pathway protease TraF